MRFILVFLIALSFPAFGQVYKWTDAKGNVHFGSQPPPGEQHEIKIRESKTGPMITDRQRQMLDRENFSRPDYSSDYAADETPDYICTGAKNRVIDLKERWDNVKRQGYTVSQQSYYEQSIREAKRHRDNICR